MKSKKLEKAKARSIGVFKSFVRLRSHYRKLAWKSSSFSCLITVITIVAMPFFGSLPSEIVIFDNATEHNIQIININYESRN